MIYSFTRCQLKTQHDTNSAAATAQLRVQLRTITVRQTGRCLSRVTWGLNICSSASWGADTEEQRPHQAADTHGSSHGEVQDGARIHSKLTLHFLLLEGTHLSERVRLQTGSEDFPTEHEEQWRQQRLHSPGENSVRARCHHSLLLLLLLSLCSGWQTASGALPPPSGHRYTFVFI